MASTQNTTGVTKVPNKNDFIKGIIKNLIDDLNRFMIAILLVLIIITIFIRNFYLDILKFLILIILIFRIASKNKSKRYQENQNYLKIKNILLKPFTNIARNFKDRKKYVYKKCRKCKTTLKLPLPSSRGINHAKCPNCGYRVTLFTLRKKQEEKVQVEVIKKSRKGEK